jgi:hypothetical protein
METNTWWETTKVQGGELVDRVRQLVREGNVRRIVIKQGDRSIAEFPLAAGVVGVFFAPMLAAVGALAALITDCSIAVEREVTASPADGSPVAAAPDAKVAPVATVEAA